MERNFFSLNILKIYLILQTITRLFLSGYAINHNQITFYELPGIFGIGLLNDVISLCYFLPIIYILAFIFSKFFPRKLLSGLFFISYFLVIISLIFNLIAEVIFWDEFGTKFNFIAVDYLIYTNEIIGTLKESLPFYEILIAIIAISALIVFFIREFIIEKAKVLNISHPIIHTASLLLLSIIIYNFYDEKKLYISSNRYANELAQNGPYQLFAAFFNNSLDYDKFYPTIDKELAFEIVREKIKQKDQDFLNDNNINRIVNGEEKSEKYNVIVITVESLSAEFMGKFGNKNNLTPNLDKLAEESIFFTNLYASGTRTVRGLEAISLSVPPIPGSSIIRRPNNQRLFTIGNEFKNQGYDINFIFGGYSYFDNLKNYFNGNEYNIIDRSNLKSQEISFSNIWGVADEDILLKSIEVANKSYNSGIPFFSLIMTTSNHRPYTFPEGRIDLPSGGGRQAAVKYTDYAIGRFFASSKNLPWFDNTIFVITADHCAASAGKTELPIDKYHIPLMIYAPKILKPRKIENLASQIDIAPTIFGILKFKYKTKFFGCDIINFPANRAFIGTYQLLGLLKDDHLVVLAPKSIPKIFKLVGKDKHEVHETNPLVQEAISFYMIANDLYSKGKMKDFKFE